MRPQRPLPTVPFAKSRYAAARTCAAAILAAICPGGTMPISTARWPHRRCGRRTASAWSSVHSVSGDATTVKHPLPPRSAKYFHVPDAVAGTIFAEADMREQGANTLQGLAASRVLACGVAMVAKLLLLIALLAPVLTVAAGIFAHRDKRSKRDAHEDRKST
jgi:hypothetical protein